MEGFAQAHLALLTIIRLQPIISQRRKLYKPVLLHVVGLFSKGLSLLIFRNHKHGPSVRRRSMFVIPIKRHGKAQENEADSLVVSLDKQQLLSII